MVWGGGLLGGAETGLSALIFGSTDGVANVVPIDFAGGTAVHINAGVAGLVLALVLGKRIGFGKDPMRPHNLPLIMIGAGLLWFGWFGFNAGSALARRRHRRPWRWVNTTVATCAAMLGWLLVEKIRDGHATSLGAASGVVAGLVAITPACGALSPLGAIVLGVVAGALCALAVGLKYKLGFDDSLDVVGVHLVGGVCRHHRLPACSPPSDRPVLRRRRRPARHPGPRSPCRAIVFSGRRHPHHRPGHQETIGLRINEDDEVEGIDLPSTPRRRTTSSVRRRSRGRARLRLARPAAADSKNLEGANA